MKKYSSYIPSPMKWNSTLPVHWNIRRLKLVLQERKESNFPVKTENILSLTNTRGVIPYAEKGNIGNKSKDNIEGYHIAEINDLVINSMNVVIGSVGVSKYFGAISPVYYALYPRNGENIYYYEYIFKLSPFEESLKELGNGILDIRKRIPMIKLNNVFLPVPPRDEQDQIVRFLDWKVSMINRLINTKRKEIKSVDAMKRSVVSSAVTRGLDTNAPMKFSGVKWLGDIPAHWTTIKLRQLLSPVSVKNHPELPLLSVVREQGVIVRDIDDKEANHNYIPDDLSGYKMVKQGQFAMNKMKAWQGSYGISDYTGIVSPAYFIFDVSFDNLEYFHYAIRSKVYVNFFAQASDGIRVGQWDLQMDKMKEIPFFVPPADEQVAIVEYIKKTLPKYDEAIEKLTAEVSALEEYKAKLIADVVTGKVDVRYEKVPNYEFVDEDADSEEEGESEGSVEQEG